MRLPAFLRIEQNARRLTAVLTVLGRYGLADWLGGLNYKWIQSRLVSAGGEALGKLPREARIRLALTDLGTTYIKFGQMLSTRKDLVGPTLAAELARLRSNTPPDPPAVVRATILAEFDRPVEQFFSSFEDQPIASASIAQVHRARLPSGEVVAVKVQHAGIAEKVAGDLDIMTGLAKLLQKHVTVVRNYRPVAMIREFRRILMDEMDFSSERRHLEEFRKNFASDAGVRFPAVHLDLCSRRVLTMELLEGISAEDTEGLLRAGVDLKECARRGAELYLQMIFRDGFYHADPHPGNLMVLGTPSQMVLGVLDCGMVGRVDEYLQRDLEDLILGIIHGDAARVADTVVRLGSTPADLDLERLRSALATFMAEHTNRSLRDLDLSRMIDEMTDIIWRYRIVLPPACSLLLKTLVMLEGTGRQFSPDFSLAELIRPYGAFLLQRRFSWKRWLARLERTYRDWDRFLEMLPREAGEILQRLRNGSLELHHQLPRTDTAVNRLSVAILCAGLLVASAEMLSRAAPPTLHGISILGVAGYLIAAWLGWKLVRAIGQSDTKEERDE